MTRRPHPLLLASLVALMIVAWSLNFIIGKVALRHLDVVTLVAFRLVLSALILLPIYFLTPGRASLNRSDLGTFAVLGFFGVAMNQGLFTAGLNYTTVGHSSIIIATGPILILLMARAQRLEVLTASKAIGMAISFLGVAFLAAEHGLSLSSETLTGDLITLGGTAGFAIYSVLGKKVAAKYDTVSMNTFNCLTAAILALPVALFQGLRIDWGAVGWAGWSAMAYMAAISSVLAYLIYFWALRHMAASRLAAVVYIEPVLVTLLGIILLGERLTAHLVAGGLLVLFGVYLTERGPREDGNVTPADEAAK